MNDAPVVAVIETPRATAAGVATAGTFTPCTFGSAGPPNFHAAMTSAVSSTMAVTAIATRRDSRCWRWRRALGRHAVRPQWMFVFAGDIPGVVLVDVELAVHPECVRVRSQEPLDVRVTGQLIELLRFECAEVLGPDLRPELHLVEIKALPRAGLAKA